MLFEIGSSLVMGAVAGWAYLHQKGPAINDADKIQRIFSNSGLAIKEKGVTKTIRLHRKENFPGGCEYVYQLPLGLSSKQVIEKRHVLEDGLNVRHRYLDFNPADLLKLKWNRTIVSQIRSLLTDKKTGRKEIDIDFDGMLRIKVYNEPLPQELNWDDSLLNYSSWKIPVGQNRKEFIYHDFSTSPHIIVAGGTGFGKSQFLKMLITSLILTHPEDVEFSLVDLKGGTAFQRFADLQQVKRYGRTPKEAREVLTEVQLDMERTLDFIVSNGHEDVTEAGIKKRNFVVVDEAADMASDSDSMDIVADIGRRGRGAGFHLVYCTQYPTNETIPSQVRPNIGARVCFKLKTNIQSRAVLDDGGAEDLPEIPGRGIYQLNKNVIVQTPYMTNAEIKEAIEPFKRGAEDEQKGNETTAHRRYSFEFERV